MSEMCVCVCVYQSSFFSSSPVYMLIIPKYLIATIFVI